MHEMEFIFIDIWIIKIKQFDKKYMIKLPSFDSRIANEIFRDRLKIEDFEGKTKNTLKVLLLEHWELYQCKQFDKFHSWIIIESTLTFIKEKRMKAKISQKYYVTTEHTQQAIDRLK